MNFRPHYAISGKHAFLSASSYHWISYDDHKIDTKFHAHRQAARGTALHELAHKAIELGIHIAEINPTIARYVADGIGYRMAVEQPLYYSENAFGTPDTISFRNGLLRIHDLKTGMVKTSFHQLEVYAAYFCLEYEFSPWDIEIELRIYQSDEVLAQTPEPNDILHIMDKIVTFDRRIEQLKEGAIDAD